jgi:high-affinity nickel permease
MSRKKVERLDLKTLERIGVNAPHPHLLNIAHRPATVLLKMLQRIPGNLFVVLFLVIALLIALCFFKKSGERERLGLLGHAGLFYFVGMTHVLGADEIDDLLGNVGRMVGNALEGF